MQTTTEFPPTAPNSPSASGQAVQFGSGASTAPIATNVTRLRLVMALFRLTQQDICRATGYSKAFVSQLLSGKDFGQGERFWMRLNASLHDAVRPSASNVFDVTPLSLPDGLEKEIWRCP